MDKHQIQSAAIVVVIAVGFIVGIWWPQHVKRNRLQAQIDHEKQQLSHAAALRQDMHQWYGQILNLRRQLKHFPETTPSQTKLAHVLRQLSAAVNNAGVDDQEVTTGSISSVHNLVSIPIQIRFRGSFPAAYAVVHRVESMDAVLRVDDLEIHRPSNSNQSQQLRVQLQLSTFFKQDHRGS